VAVVGNLEVNNHLFTCLAVSDNQQTGRTGSWWSVIGARVGATLGIDVLVEAVEKVALLDDLQLGLDGALLIHGKALAVAAEVDQAVLLEQRTEHVVEDNRGRGMRNHAGLLMEVLGEQVNTKVTMLTGLLASGDFNNLARAVLEDDEVTNTDVVARNAHHVLVLVARDVNVAVSRAVAVNATSLCTSVIVVTVFVSTVGVLVVNGVGIVLAHSGRFRDVGLKGPKRRSCGAGSVRRCGCVRYDGGGVLLDYYGLGSG